MANTAPPKWALTPSLPRIPQTGSSLMNLPAELKMLILENLLLHDQGRYIQTFRTSAGHKYSLGSRTEDFRAGLNFMQSSQESYEVGAHILYEANTLRIRAHYTRRQHPDGSEYFGIEFSFLNQTHTMRIGIDKWPRPTNSLFIRLARPSPTELMGFYSIQKYYRIVIVNISHVDDSRGCLFWTCHLLKRVLLDSHVFFQLRHLTIGNKIIHQNRASVSPCAMLRCASVDFERGTQVPHDLQQYLNGSLRLRSNWPEFYRLQKIVASLPTVKRVQFKHFYHDDWEWVTATAHSFARRTFSFYLNKILTELIPLWILHWRNEGLRWADRQIRDAKAEIAALRQRQAGQYQLIRSQNKEKDQIFLQTRQAVQKLKEMIHGDMPDFELGLKSRQIHLQILSPIRDSSELHDLQGNGDNEEGRRVSETRTVRPKRLAVPDFHEREQKRRRTQ